MEQPGGELGVWWGMFQAEDTGNHHGQPLEGPVITVASVWQGQYSYGSQ